MMALTHGSWHAARLRAGPGKHKPRTLWSRLDFGEAPLVPSVSSHSRSVKTYAPGKGCCGLASELVSVTGLAVRVGLPWALA